MGFINGAHQPRKVEFAVLHLDRIPAAHHASPFAIGVLNLELPSQSHLRLAVPLKHSKTFRLNSHSS